MTNSALSSKEVVSKFEQSFSNFSQQAQTTYERVSHVKVVCDAALPKVDHVAYMQKAYRAVEINDPNCPEAQEVMMDSHKCQFGQWYDSGNGEESYSHLPVFSSINEPHSDLHNTVHDIIDRIRNSGWQMKQEVCESIYQAFIQAEAASTDLVRLVDKMADEKKIFESNTDAKDAGEIDLF